MLFGRCVVRRDRPLLAVATNPPDSCSRLERCGLTLRSIPSPAPSIDADNSSVCPRPRGRQRRSRDLAAGLARSWIWSALSYQDIKLRYRGSLLGPFWVTLTNLILVVAMGGIYGALFHIETEIYVPFLMCGLSSWQFISTMANRGLRRVHRRGGCHTASTAAVLDPGLSHRLPQPDRAPRTTPSSSRSGL